MPDSNPFWICHECGAQMRPLTIDGVPHCASCNSEFIEILDSEINPDPRHELPPPPPTRPGQPAPPIPGGRPVPGGGGGGGAGAGEANGPPYEMGGLLAGLFDSIFGGGNSGGQRPPSANAPGGSDGREGPGQVRPAGAGQDTRAPNPGIREFSFNMGGGQLRIQTYAGNPFLGGFAGAPGNANDGLDTYFQGFGAAPRRDANGRGGPPNIEGMDLLQALMAIIADEGNGAALGGLPGNGQMGDYVMTERFNDVLERLMQMAGPQGPLPAPEAVIDALPRFTFTEKTLEECHYKDCPVCKDDFAVDDVVIRLECEHVFHVDCLVPWLKTNGSCPVCRFSLVPENPQAPLPTPTAAAGSSTAPPPQAEAQRGQTPLGFVQGAFTGVLNRLFGQGGTASGSNSPVQPRSPVVRPTGPPDAAAQWGDDVARALDETAGQSNPRTHTASPPVTQWGSDVARALNETAESVDTPVATQPGPRSTSNPNAESFSRSFTQLGMPPDRYTPERRRSGSPTRPHPSPPLWAPRRQSTTELTDTDVDTDDPPEPIAGDVPASGLNAAIPEDYRAMHARREREMAERQGQGQRGQQGQQGQGERNDSDWRGYDPLLDELD